MKAPLDEWELKDLYKESKKQATTLFKKIAVGEDVSHNFLDVLKDKMKTKYLHMKDENERHIESSWNNWLIQNYT
jgi:hypothetical protein